MIRNITPYVSNQQHQKTRHDNKIKKIPLIATVKDSVKVVSQEYCNESSICGLKHLVDRNTPFMERLIWVIVLIGGLACSVSLVWMTFRKYNTAPLVTTKMPEGVSVTNIIFPAVGICTNNRISRKAVTKLADKLLKEERNKKYNKSEMLSLLGGLGQLYNLQPVNDKIINSQTVHKVLGAYDVDELMKELTPRCEDILQKCAWNEMAINCTRLFDFRLTMNGYCCTFNYLRSSDVFENTGGSNTMDMYKYGNQSSFKFDQGLKVLLNIDQSDDFFSNIPLKGAQLQFSDAYDFPDAPSGSYSVQLISPNVKMTVMVAASFTKASRDIQHVSVTLRRCLFFDESPYLTFYTYSDCMLKCRMLFLMEHCSCTPFNMPKMNARTCDMRDVPCLRMYYARSITVRPTLNQPTPELELELVGGGISCPMCFPTCSKTDYNYDFANVNIYPDILNQIPDNSRDMWVKGANFTGTSIVHVKYGREFADCYEQNVIMKWFDLISNIGSTCGFVTGFSFVSILEFLYFSTIKLYREFLRRRQSQKENHQDPSSYRKNNYYNSQQVTQYRPLYWNEIATSTKFNAAEYLRRLES